MARSTAGLVPGLRLVEMALPLDWLAGQPEEVEAAGHRIAALKWLAALLFLTRCIAAS